MASLHEEDSSVENELIDELAELKTAFKSIASDGENLSWRDLSEWPELKGFIAGEQRSNETLHQIFQGIAGGKDTIEFEQFLQFLDFCEAQGNEEHLTRIQGDANFSGDGKEKIVALLRRASRSTTTQPLSSVREALTKHFKLRPGRTELEQSGIYQPIPGAQALERQMTKDQLKKQLSQRQSKQELEAQGIQVVSEVAHDLEKQLKKDQLKHQLEKRQSIQELTQQGIRRDTNPTLEHADRNLARSQVNRGLERRQSKERLQSSGIYIDSTAQRVSLERQLIRSHLNRSLGSDLRPHLEDLQRRGVFRSPIEAPVSYTYTASALLHLERQLAKARLSHALQDSNRPDPQQLRDQGILLDQTPAAYALEKQLSKDLVKRGLENRHGVDELQKLGILELSENKD